MAQKSYFYEVLDNKGNVLENLTKITTEPKFYSEINTLVSSMTLKLAVNEIFGFGERFGLTDQDGYTITDQDGADVTMVLDNRLDYGRGSIIDKANSIDIKFSRKSSVTIADADDYTMTDQDGTIMTDGADTALARRLFKGLIVGDSLSLSSQSDVTLRLLSDSYLIAKAPLLDEGETHFDYAIQELSDILRDWLDKLIALGFNVNYTADSIQNTGLLVNFKVNGMDYQTAINNLTRLAPDTWYYRYNLETGLFSFMEFEEEPDFLITRSKDDFGARLGEGSSVGESTEQLYNHIIVIGEHGSKGEAKDHNSIKSYGLRTKFVQDKDITNDYVAHILARSELSRTSKPVEDGTAYIIDSALLPVEDIQPGMTVGFRGYGRSVDDTYRKVVSIDYSPDVAVLRLGYLIPSHEKRILGLKADLGNFQRASQ